MTYSGMVEKMAPTTPFLLIVLRPPTHVIGLTAAPHAPPGAPNGDEEELEPVDSFAITGKVVPIVKKNYHSDARVPDQVVASPLSRIPLQVGASPRNFTAAASSRMTPGPQPAPWKDDTAA